MPATTTNPTSTAVKALNDTGAVGGYLVVWGNAARKDLQGEYFTPETDLGIGWYPQRPALYHHGLDADVSGQMVGAIKSLTPDDTGVWAEAQLDLHNKWGRAVHELVQKGVLAWSSGSLPHLVEVARDGHIKRWPIVEGSLTPTPAEPRDTGITPLKHMSDLAQVRNAYKSVGLDDSDLLIPDDANEGAAVQEQDEIEQSGVTQPTELEDTKEETIMADNVTVAAPDPDVIAQAVQAEMDRREKEREADELKAKAARVDEMAAQLAEANEKLAAKEASKAQPARRLPGAENGPGAENATGEDNPDVPRIEVRSKYDSLKAADMAFGYMLMNKNDGLTNREQYVKAMAVKAVSEGIQLSGKFEGMKADELGYSTLASYGDEWVPDAWSAMLWEKARLENTILPLFEQIEMPTNPYELPIEGTDPTVYYVSETQDEANLTLDSANNPTPDSQIGSGKVQLSAKKLSLRVGFSRELVEDSIIPILPRFQQQAIRSMSDAIDNVLLNGDTTTAATGNINSDDAAPSAQIKYLAFDGLRHLPLVTNTANAQDASGAPTLALLRTTRSLLSGKYGVNPKNLTWIVDYSTYMKLLGLTEVVTVDKYGPNATVLTGEMGMVDGIRIVVSAEAGLTEADGKISATAGNNTKGQAILVYRPGWVVGYRRQVMATAKYFEEFDAYQLFAHARLAFNRFDTDVAAALYDITV